MAYQPSLEDLQGIDDGGYTPSMEDIPNEGTGSIQTFLSGLPAHQKFIGEKILNPPTQEEKIKLAGATLPFVAPPIRAVPLISNILSKIPMGTGIGNMLGRIGYGTALTTAPEALTQEGRENIGEKLQSNLGMNALIEAGTMPFRGLHGMAELFNPINYSRSKAATIKGEHDAAKTVMEKNYEPINQTYGNFPLSVTPEKYLKDAGINKDSLYADAQGFYNDFLKEPTYKNLLGLKSQIGRDWARISPSDQVRDIQLFNKYNKNLDNKLRNFLQRDPEMLSQYNLANKYAENVFYPYLSTPTLKSIAKGKYNAIYPDKMAKSLDKATNRVVGADYKYRIPLDHPLRNHLKDLNNRIALGDIAELAVPTIGGAVGGAMLGHGISPGLGSFAGMGSGSLGGFLAGLGGSKALRYPVVQSPAVQNIFSKAEPLYYKTARALVGENQ